MKLILVRHAAAMERSEDIPEEQRYLTAEGRAFLRKTARTMLRNGVEPSLILTSPLTRAVQTADILAETLSFIGPVILRNELAPGFDLVSLRKLLADYPQVDELVVVGHEPDLGAIVSELLSRRNGCSLKKGVAVKLKLGTDLQPPVSFKWLASGKKLIQSKGEAFSSSWKGSICLERVFHEECGAGTPENQGDRGCAVAPFRRGWSRQL